MLLQRYTDASGHGPGVRCLRCGPAATQSTDPGGVRDSAAPPRQRVCAVRPGRAAPALHDEEQVPNHAVHSGGDVSHMQGVDNI